MSNDDRLTCLDCGTPNRVPSEKLDQSPKCGVCGAKLVTDKVAEIDPATLTKASKDTTLPLVVDFWAPWCGPCRAMAPQFASAAKSMQGKVRFAKLNTEQHPSASNRYGIRGIPAMIAFKKGKEAGRRVGALPQAGILQFAQSIK